MAINQRADFHVADEFGVTGPTVAQRRAEGVERVVAFAELYSIDLHLFAGGCLETDDRFNRQGRFHATQEASQLAHPACVALGHDLPMENCRGNPQGDAADCHSRK